MSTSPHVHKSFLFIFFSKHVFQVQINLMIKNNYQQNTLKTDLFSGFLYKTQIAIFHSIDGI